MTRVGLVTETVTFGGAGDGRSHQKTRPASTTRPITTATRRGAPILCSTRDLPGKGETELRLYTYRAAFETASEYTVTEFHGAVKAGGSEFRVEDQRSIVYFPRDTKGGSMSEATGAPKSFT